MSNMENKTYYVVMNVQPWSTIGMAPSMATKLFPVSDPIGDFPAGSHGYLMVFDNRADAEAWADGDVITEIETVKRAALVE